VRDIVVVPVTVVVACDVCVCVCVVVPASSKFSAGRYPYPLPILRRGACDERRDASGDVCGNPLFRLLLILVLRGVGDAVQCGEVAAAARAVDVVSQNSRAASYDCRRGVSRYLEGLVSARWQMGSKQRSDRSIEALILHASEPNDCMARALYWWSTG
jgi:hypothetical protein